MRHPQTWSYAAQIPTNKFKSHTEMEKYKRNITLLCMIGIFFFLISCGKEDKTVLQSEENDVSKKNVVKSEIQTDTLEGAGIKGNYYEGESKPLYTIILRYSRR